MTEQNQNPVTKSFTQLKESAQGLLKAAEEAQAKINARIANGETVDATKILVNDILPLLSLLNKNQVEVLESLEEVEDNDEDFFDEDGEGGEGDEEDGDEGGEEYEEGDEDFVEISQSVLDKVIFFLRLHAFDIPNGNQVDENLKSPETLRLVLAEMLNDVDSDSWPIFYGQLVQNYPNVPFQKEIDEQVRRGQEQNTEAQGGGEAANTGDKA